jgi:hypothetical protein
MLDYLKAAFWAGVDVRGLGRLPVNALAALGFAILGVGHPGFWLLGAGLEAGFLALLATHPRFQKAIDARRDSLAAGAAEQGRQELASHLPPEARRRLDALEEKCARALAVARDAHADDFELASRRDALDRLAWIYLKLLTARRQLETTRESAGRTDLEKRIADLERETAAGASTAALQQSQAATLGLLRQRLRNLDRCEQALKQVDSDLARTEAQVDLALESAGVQGGGAADVANLELASEVFGEGFDYGDLSPRIAALDQAYAAPPPRERGPG